MSDNPYESPRYVDPPRTVPRGNRWDRASAGLAYGLVTGAAAGSAAMFLAAGLVAVAGWHAEPTPGSDPLGSVQTLAAGFTGVLIFGGVLGGFAGLNSGLILGALLDWRLLRARSQVRVAGMLLLAAAAIAASTWGMLATGVGLHALGLTAAAIYVAGSPLSGRILADRLAAGSCLPGDPPATGS